MSESISKVTWVAIGRNKPAVIEFSLRWRPNGKTVTHAVAEYFIKSDEKSQHKEQWTEETHKYPKWRQTMVFDAMNVIK